MGGKWVGWRVFGMDLWVPFSEAWSEGVVGRFLDPVGLVFG